MISVNQPYFFPFVGFFYKAYLSDILVILDDVQFPRGTTWISRNRFKNAQGTLWMTVPVIKKGLGLQKINTVRIHDDNRWAKKHLQSLKNAYIRAPYFKEHLYFLEGIYSTTFEKLIHLNLKIIRYFMAQLRVDTKVILSSELGIHGKGDKLLLDICDKLGASQLLIQKAARKYINPDRLWAEGIELREFRPPSPVYPQLWGDFIPSLSALDLILNCGPKAYDIMMSAASRSGEIR
jgi:hypothetical protein